MPLRLRLLAGLLVVVAAGVVIVDVVTYVSLRSFLFDRVDEQLLGARLPANLGLSQTQGTSTANNAVTNDSQKGRLSYLPPGTYAELRNGSGQVIQTATFALSAPGPQPKLPAMLTAPSTDENDPGRFFTADAKKSSEQYRVLVSGLRDKNTLVVAIPLNDVNSTLNRLIIIELIVSLAAIAGVCLVGWWLVRLGLRPLDQVARTANAIADGDMGRRIEHTNQRTEVGRLGLAFNTMVDRIQQAFDERAATERRLRQFVADASHELRTPLTSIRGYAELFSHDAGRRSAQDVEGAMGRIEAETRRMGVMVEDLLLLARLDQEAPVERRPLDLSRIAEECAADARVVEPGRVWSTEIEPGVTAAGDEDRLRQVVSNLVANVRHHTPAGASAMLRVYRSEGDAVIEVSDSGPGIAPGAIRHVFERFYRVDKARSRRRGGNGLGLAIVQAIVTAHGGRVEASSEEGKGTRFTVRIPALPAEAPQDAPPAAPAPSVVPSR